MTGAPGTSRELSLEVGEARPGPVSPVRKRGTDDVVVGVAQAALGYLLGSLGACLVLLARDLAVPRTHLAWLSAGFGAALLAAGPTGSTLLAWGPRRLLRLAAAVLAAGICGLAVAPAVVVAEAAALLIGVGGAGIVLSSAALLTGPAAARRLSRVNAAASVAGIVGPIALSLADPLPGSGRLALLLPLPLLLWLVWARVPGTREPDPPGAAGHPPPAGVPWPRGAVAAGLLARWAVMVLAVAAEFAFAVWSAARLQDGGLGVSSAAAAAAAFPLGMATGRLAAPPLLDRLPLVPLSALLVLVAAAVLATPAGPVLCTGALALAGLGIAVLYPVTLSELMQQPGLADTHAAALGATASGIAILAGPLLFGAAAAVVTLPTAFLILLPLMPALLLLRVVAGRCHTRGRRIVLMP